MTVTVVKAQKAKTKSSKSQSAIKEMHNGLPSRVTSNGLVDDSTTDNTSNTKLGTATSKAKKKSKSSKHNKTNQSAVDSQSNVEAASEREVKVCDFFIKILPRAGTGSCPWFC